MIFALCGTGDARELAVRIQQSGFELLTSVVTDNAANSLREANLSVRIGRLGKDGLVTLIRREEVRAIVDASHPFAEEAHRNAMAAAEEAGIPYIRFERASLDYGDDPRLTVVSSYEEAAAESKKCKGSVMLTTGCKTLHIFAGHLLGDPEIRLVVRTLPRRDNMERCEELGVEQKNIIALQGPFSRELNEALYRQYGTTVMVTKESGKPGAVDEKIAAALELGIRVILISRPDIDFGAVFTDFQDVIEQLNKVAR
ncbi:precorrin-6A/cobalt-precorrin-6A reductase [Paenibacillus forsythiae]|uniref:Precorrin-6A/cobalt-precorrin-6A reductase n=1 Tax=Paenibacillus forsythiae TaxID=365616 RepID=A0ABU3HDN0_9BACL|nr:precorrin-6A reductase [Paenibacillus forsythiae]MDT3428917.1 precorrin-6A/cobalt-precorrin-6A reductase [Paenibacillus forsythiae]